ncbi:hypothetical protein TVAG_012560 [Trichomonas vaginalis G3]|uniref:Uncharacterized protein n=1 Tax=Trichomonas vaginalis (strain ATCC PRA-98 / G3) TaxID=412133 RepID=A2E906_TRIV3|nr:bifunctional inhibitor/lipid-transfer protein/seed storage 2s albumin superfamily protein family [Trichomonas vaginalis G3]EAY10890.1 hypothetical protein TVAG_012560 [Trichomonas vaginalis G3]KAI5482937.1 bifunctional inhibitor/lipid-transfer protein/seed storage 2s albumin superfamily protein family [Trichomonas vaginalis G3]|eukprot:XP_001323113.1 hypothetical protein [Trichomonas vaginalis G3]
MNNSNSHITTKNHKEINSSLSNQNKTQNLHKNNLNLSLANDLLHKTDTGNTRVNKSVSNLTGSEKYILNEIKNDKRNRINERNTKNISNTSIPKGSKKIGEFANNSDKTQLNSPTTARNTSNPTIHSNHIHKTALTTQNDHKDKNDLKKIDNNSSKSYANNNKTHIPNNESQNHNLTQEMKLNKNSKEKIQNQTVNHHKDASKIDGDAVLNRKSNGSHLSNPNLKQEQTNTTKNNQSSLSKENHSNQTKNSLINQNQISHQKQLTKETTTAKIPHKNIVSHTNISKQTPDSSKNQKHMKNLENSTKTKQTQEIIHSNQVKTSVIPTKTTVKQTPTIIPQPRTTKIPSTTVQKQTTNSVISHSTNSIFKTTNSVSSRKLLQKQTPIATAHQTQKQTIVQHSTHSATVSQKQNQTKKETIYVTKIPSLKETPSPRNIPMKTPHETIKQTPIIIPKQTTIFIPKQTPIETAKPTIIETTIQKLIQTPAETVKQTPHQITKETPNVISAQTTKFIPKQTPIETEKQKPIQTPAETIKQTPVETPIQEPIQTPQETIKETPTNIPFQTPSATPIITLYKEIPERSPIQTVREKPIFIPQQTPILLYEPIQTIKETPQQTIIQTPFETPQETPQQTPYETIKETVYQTPAETPLQTPFETPIYTPMPTPTPQHAIFLQDLPQSISQTLSITTRNSYTHIINITEKYTYFTPQIREQFSFHFFINEKNTYKYVGQLQENHIGFHFGASTGLVYVNHTTLELQHICYITYKENKKDDYFFVFHPSQFNSNTKPIENKEMFRVKSEMVRCNSLLDSYISKFDNQQKTIFEKNRQIFKSLNQDSFHINITESGWKIIFIDKPKTIVYSLNITNASITAFYLSKGSYIPFAQISDKSPNMISIGDRSGVLLIEGTPNTTVIWNAFTTTGIYPGSGYFEHICSKQQITNERIKFFESKIKEEIKTKTKLNNLLNLPFEAYAKEMTNASSLSQTYEIESKNNPIKQILATFDENGTYTYIFPAGNYDVFFPNMSHLTINYFIYKDKTGDDLKYYGQIHNVKNYGNLIVRHNLPSLILVQSKELKSFQFVYINQGLVNCHQTYISNYDAKENNFKNVVKNSSTRLQICNLRLIDRQTNYKLFYKLPETSFVSIYSPQNTRTRVLQFSGYFIQETALPFLEVYSFVKNEEFQTEFKITKTSLDREHRFSFSYENIKKTSIVFPDKITNLQIINNPDIVSFVTEHLANINPEMPRIQEKNIVFTSSLQTEDPQSISFESKSSIPHEIFLDKPHTVVIIPDLYTFTIRCFTRNENKINYFGSINSKEHLGVFFGNNSGILYVTSFGNKKFQMYTLHDNSNDDYFFIKKPNLVSKRNFEVENNITLKNISLEIESNKRNHVKDLSNNHTFYRGSVCFPKTEFNYRDIYLSQGTTILFTNKKRYNVFYFKENDKQRMVPIEVQTPENDVYGYHYGLLTNGAIRIKLQGRNSCIEFLIFNSTNSVETFSFSINDLKFLRTNIRDIETEIAINSFYKHLNNVNKTFMMKYAVKNTSSINETETTKKVYNNNQNNEEEKKKQQESRIKIIGGGDDSSIDLDIIRDNDKESFPELNLVFEWRSGNKYNLFSNSTIHEGYSYQRIIIVYVFICLPLSSILGAIYFSNIIYGCIKPSNIESILNHIGENTLGVEENDEYQESNTDYNDQYLDDNHLQDLNPT